LVKNTNPEHVLAALVGCDLDNVIIELNTSELPIMDGSSKYFVEALEKAGIEEQNTKRNIYVVKEIISLLMRKVGAKFNHAK
jgi:UDP-3-O-[3-hydroxymyristoyl] N-acetylglucosamine deacetylase/3-hydroxyacyl-[acyl-carrier-protein] dehydratase